jgi:FtsH-binding integral membrane protein
VYGHLVGAIIAFVVLEVVFFQTGMAFHMAQAMLSVSWLFILGAFVVIGWIASFMANRVESLPLQYAALGIYVVAEAIIFVPLLYIAELQVPGVIGSAGTVTLLGFGALTGIVFFTKKDFSFLRPVLMFAGILALVGIVASFIFGFTLGVWFSVAMIALAGGSILYQTSEILHHHPSDRYVGAALGLFASVALLFWYVLRLFMQMQSDD